MNAAPPAIELEALTKDFSLPGKGRSLRAVDSLTLSVPRNAVFGLLGPNGSGKSTTIRILLGLSRPSSGTARVFGANPSHPEARRKIGYLPDAPYYARTLSGRELLHFFGKIQGLSRRERRQQAESLLVRFGLEEAMDRRLGAYSKGMLQRLGFAQALIGDPELLVLDEPTAGVDPVGAQTLGAFVSEQKARGKTILLCSHFLTQVQELCDQIGILNKGRLLASGEMDALLHQQSGAAYTASGLGPESVEAFKALAQARGVRFEPKLRDLDELFHSLIEADQNRKGGSL